MTKLGFGLVIALVVAGCGGSQKGSSAKDACMKGATNVGDIFKRELGAEIQGIDEVVPKIQAAFADHCVADKWSPEAIACISTATDHTGLDKCEPLITAAQKDALKADVEGAMGGVGYGDAAPPDDSTGGAKGDEEGGGGGSVGADPCGGGE